MKNLLLPLCLLLFQVSFAQQQLKDKFDYEVTYELTYRIDSTHLEEEKKEFMILYIGKGLSVFSSRAKTLVSQFIIRGNMGHTNREALTDFLFVTLKSRETGKIYSTVDLSGDLFYYEEDLALFDWQIHPETRLIKGYQAQKATTDFAGRSYVAWFTPEVPVPEGPYKFNGLPGLILEIADTQQHWVFTFTGLEKLTPPKDFKVNFRQYIALEKEPLMERFNTYRMDPMGYSLAQGRGKNVSVQPRDLKKLAAAFAERAAKMNNPLELK